MSQTYPIGRDNLNQLMQLQLGTEAFDIIRKVADNLDLIKKASEASNNIDYSSAIQTLNERLDKIEKQLQGIQTSIHDIHNSIYGIYGIQNSIYDIHTSIHELTSRLDAIQPSP